MFRTSPQKYIRKQLNSSIGQSFTIAAFFFLSYKQIPQDSASVSSTAGLGNKLPWGNSVNRRIWSFLLVWQTNIVLKPHPFRAFSGESLGMFLLQVYHITSTLLRFPKVHDTPNKQALKSSAKARHLFYWKQRCLKMRRTRVEFHVAEQNAVAAESNHINGWMGPGNRISSACVWKWGTPVQQ